MSIICPYIKPLTRLVVDPIESENIQVYDYCALEGVQMSSLAAVPLVEAHAGLPVVSAPVCTTWKMLTELGLETRVPNAGSLLTGRY